jgi:multidrug efflux system membrane fusion protein
VRSGLEEGERVIVNGLQRVRPNDQVAPVLANDESRPQASMKTVIRDDKQSHKKQI